jgi:hypothetical protein
VESIRVEGRSRKGKNERVGAERVGVERVGAVKGMSTECTHDERLRLFQNVENIFRFLELRAIITVV